jgi:hypothetical protein
MTKSILKFLYCTLLLGVLMSCSMAVVHTPVELSYAGSDQQVLKKLAKPVEVRFDTGYSRSLKAGSQWMQIGRIPQGDVYKPYKDVFTVEGSHIHEAYLVVSNDKLIGFYLPYEKGFSSLQQSVLLTLE